MQRYQVVEEEGYDNRPSRSNLYQFDAAPAIMIDFVTEMSSNGYPSSNEVILTPQDSNSMDDQVRGSLSGAKYPDRSEGSLSEYTEAPENSTMSHLGNMHCFNAGFGTQFDTEGGNGSQMTGDVDAAATRGSGIGTSWDEDNVGQYPRRDTQLNKLRNLYFRLTDIQCRCIRTSPGSGQVGTLLQLYRTSLANFISQAKRTCLADLDLHAQRIRRIIRTNFIAAA